MFLDNRVIWPSSIFSVCFLRFRWFRQEEVTCIFILGKFLILLLLAHDNKCLQLLFFFKRLNVSYPSALTHCICTGLGVAAFAFSTALQAIVTRNEKRHRFCEWLMIECTYMPLEIWEGGRASVKGMHCVGQFDCWPSPVLMSFFYYLTTACVDTQYLHLV